MQFVQVEAIVLKQTQARLHVPQDFIHQVDPLIVLNVKLVIIVLINYHLQNAHWEPILFHDLKVVRFVQRVIFVLAPRYSLHVQVALTAMQVPLIVHSVQLDIIV